MKTVLNVKTDKDTKEKAQSLARYLGVPLSTVVNAYLKEFVATGALQIARETELRPEVQKRIDQGIKEAAKNKNISPKFTRAEEAITWLKA